MRSRSRSMSRRLGEGARARPSVEGFNAAAPAIRPTFLRSALRLEPGIVGFPPTFTSTLELTACYHRRGKAHNAVGGCDFRDSGNGMGRVSEPGIAGRCRKMSVWGLGPYEFTCRSRRDQGRSFRSPTMATMVAPCMSHMCLYRSAFIPTMSCFSSDRRAAMSCFNSD